MKKFLFFTLSAFLIGLTACNSSGQNNTNKMQTTEFIPDARVEVVIKQLQDSLGESHAFRVERGVRQVAGLWREQDGTADDFTGFCKSSSLAIRRNSLNYSIPWSATSR